MVVDRVRLNTALASAATRSGPAAALEVCRACVAWLPMTGVAITVMAGTDRQEPVCASDDAAARIDELQFALGDGPCVDSFTSGRAVLVADIADEAETRWPAFAAAATDTGARGMFVFPLRLGASRVGVLDCYRDTPGALDDAEVAGALRAADAAVWTLLDPEQRRTVHLDDDIDVETVTSEVAGADWAHGSTLARAEVHQATGMLIAQADIGPAAALSRLRAAAFAEGRSIGEIADDVVSRRRRLDPDGTWHTG